jgi:hypothetical protein
MKQIVGQGWEFVPDEDGSKRTDRDPGAHFPGLGWGQTPHSHGQGKDGVIKWFYPLGVRLSGQPQEKPWPVDGVWWSGFLFYT